MEVGATAVTAVPSVRRKQRVDMPDAARRWAVLGNVSLQVLGSLASHLVATWYGPVSIVVPFFYASTLLSNMVLFGAVLGLEFFDKPMRVGTLVIVVAVVLLPLVGPGTQQDQDVNALLLKKWYSATWFAALLASMFATAAALFFVDDVALLAYRRRVALLLVARASGITVNLTVSRGFVLHPTTPVFATFVALKLISGAIYTYAIVVQSTSVDQAQFVPLNATTIILVNALTGIIVWEDWRVVQSWYGYACVFVLLYLACDLLLSVPLLNEDNPEFGAPSRATTATATAAAVRRASAAVRRRASSLVATRETSPSAFFATDVDHTYYYRDDERGGGDSGSSSSTGGSGARGQRQHQHQQRTRFSSPIGYRSCIENDDDGSNDNRQQQYPSPLLDDAALQEIRESFRDDDDNIDNIDDAERSRSPRGGATPSTAASAYRTPTSVASQGYGVVGDGPEVEEGEAAAPEAMTRSQAWRDTLITPTSASCSSADRDRRRRRRTIGSGSRDDADGVVRGDVRLRTLDWGSSGCAADRISHERTALTSPSLPEEEGTATTQQSSPGR